jgi:hypothetical protein
MLQRRGDHRSDIYSLGVMLYELLCGQVPFQGDSEWEVLKKHESEPPSIPPHLTAREAAIVQRCLQKDPAARFASVHDLIAAFGGSPLVQPGPAVAVPPPLPAAPVATAAAAPLQPPPLPEVPGRARPRPVFGFVFVLFGVLLFGAVFLSRADRGGDGMVAIASAPEPGRPRVTTPGSNNPVDTLLTNLQKNIRATVQRQKRVSLRDIDTDTFAVPRDFGLYKVQLKELGKAPQWPVGVAARLERLGRPAVVAGVALLHDLDFDDEDERARGINLTRFLGQTTGIDGLVVDLDGREAGETDICRLFAVADAWRRVAEQFARDDRAFQSLLALRGKGVGGPK